MTVPLQRVSYGTAVEQDFQWSVDSAYDFETTLERLRQAIADNDLWVIHEINPQLLLERGGFAIHSARQLFYFHPRYVARILAIDPAALVDIPLKFVVMQMPDGTVSVRSHAVESLLGRYANLSALTDELSGISRRLLAYIS